MPNGNKSERFVDDMLELFDKVMVDYEQYDGGLTPQEVYEKLYTLLGITRPTAWVKGYYRPTGTGAWVYKDKSAWRYQGP